MNNQKQIWYIRLRVTPEKKAANPSTFTTRKRKHQNGTQENNNQPIQRTSTIEYRRRSPLSQNNNWTRTRIILNKNDMPQSYDMPRSSTMLKDKDNII